MVPSWYEGGDITQDGSNMIMYYNVCVVVAMSDGDDSVDYRMVKE